MSRYPRYRTPCEHWLQAPDGTWYRCGAVPTRHYLTGHKCRQHTPAALAGHPEPSSFLTRPAKPLIPPQNDSRLVDERAIASGKRRSSPASYAAARAAQQRRKAVSRRG